MNKTKNIILWLILNLFIVGFMDAALFYQGTPSMKKATFTHKLLVTEGFATAQWLAIIPASRIGNKFLSAPQLGLASFVFDFLGQVVSDIFWLKVPIAVDDWIAMFVILSAMYVSIYKIFN
jgi:uncharacterized protein (DUF486 family)